MFLTFNRFFFSNFIKILCIISFLGLFLGKLIIKFVLKINLDGKKR